MLHNMWIDVKYYIHCIAIIALVMVLAAIEFAVFVYITKLILMGV
jgi:hypothetical protein